MIRLYWPKEKIGSRQILINERKQVHYLCDVLRLKLNQDIVVFDGEEYEYLCRIQGLSRRMLTLSIKEKAGIKSQWKTELVIACALPKQKKRFDDLVDKLSQLGVDRIVPMITERVIAGWNSIQKQRHLERWRKIAEQACNQSGRNRLAVIESIKGINQTLILLECYDLKLIPTLEIGKYPSAPDFMYINRSSYSKTRKNLRDIFHSSLPKRIAVLIGPEGDFTARELIQAEKAGFIPVSLGELVLRVDTAAVAIAAFLRLYEAR